MGAISFATDFFQNDASQQKPRNINEDRMEKAFIACEKKDAAAVRQALHNFVGWLTKPEDTNADPMEAAMLACKRRDRAVITNLLKGH